MIARTAKRITDNMVESQTIPEEDRELYEYGMHQGMIMIINLITAVFIGFVLGMFWQSLMILVFFVPVRIYAGGFHAKTQGICYIFSTFIQAAAVCVLKFITLPVGVGIVIMGITACLLFILAPVEAENKPLEEGEDVKYKKKATRIWGIELLLWIVLTILGLPSLAGCIVISSALVSVLLVLGELSNIKRKFYNK